MSGDIRQVTTSAVLPKTSGDIRQVTIQEKENLRSTFAKIMQDLKVKFEGMDFRRDKRVNCYDVGKFFCANCNRDWTSRYSWVTFDLENLDIKKRWRMKCARCLSPLEPTFSYEQILVLFRKAVCWFFGLNMEEDGEKDTTPRNFSIRRSLPHLPKLCEKCCWGYDQCWMHGYQ